MLKDDVECCTLKLISGEWSEVTVNTYALTRGISIHGSNMIVEYATYMMALTYHTIDDRSNSSVSDTMKKSYAKHSQKI